jgi:hypothetical protein
MNDVKTHVYKAINNIKLELAQHGGITKDRTAPVGGGYQFRGIDDAFNVLCGLTAKHGLCMFPRVISDSPLSRIEYIDKGNGKGQTHVFLLVEVDFVSDIDGSRHTGVFLGEAIDSGDKASNKAMAAAFKYAHLHPFQIPTHGEEDDTEAYAPQVAQPRTNGSGPVKASPTAAMRAEAAQVPPAPQSGPKVVQLPVPEGVTPVPSNELAASAHNAKTFGVLHEIAKQAHKEGADPATWNSIRNRVVVLLSEAPDVATLKSAKPIMADLGSPELIVKAANVRYTELTTRQS